MSPVSVRELSQNTAGVLARVKRGEEIEVTDRGVVIARLVPAEAHPLADLIAAGLVRLPTRGGRFLGQPVPFGPIRRPAPSSGRCATTSATDPPRYRDPGETGEAGG